MLGVLAADVLDLPEPVLGLLVPPPHSEEPDPEGFGGSSAPAFDPLGAAATAADMAVRGLMERERMSRLVDFHRRDGSLPGLEEVLDALYDRAFAGPKPASERQAEIQREVQQVLVDALLARAQDPAMPPQVLFRIHEQLQKVRRLRDDASMERAQRAHLDFLRNEVGRFLDHEGQAGTERRAPPEAPPGQPIGASAMDEEPDCSFSAPGL